MKKDNIQISPLAVVHPDAQLADGVVVEAFAIIEENVIIGEGSHIHPYSMIRSGARIGANCEIHPHAVIAGVPQDLKYRGEETVAIIGDNTVVRECATVNRGTASKGKTVIGASCLIMAYAHVAHDCTVHNNVIIGNASQIAGEVEIFDYAICSGGVLIHQFVRVGDHVMIQGGTRVTKDVPPYTLIGRDPASYCGLNIVGLRRRQFCNDQIFCINDIYRTLYNRGLNYSDALKVIESEISPCLEKDKILDFIRSSQRGIVRGSID